MERILVVLSTVPDADTGGRIARTLVEEGLAACVNLLPGLRSTYVWQGKLEEASEALLVAKVRADRYSAYEERMLALHPYDVPEVVALPVEAGHEPYLRWCMEHGKSSD